MGANFITKKSINLALIKSISGIRGIIGGKVGQSLSPIDVVRYTSAFGTWLKKKSINQDKKPGV